MSVHKNSHWHKADDGEQHDSANHNADHLALGQGLVYHEWGSIGSRSRIHASKSEWEYEERDLEG